MVNEARTDRILVYESREKRIVQDHYDGIVKDVQITGAQNPRMEVTIDDFIDGKPRGFTILFQNASVSTGRVARIHTEPGTVKVTGLEVKDKTGVLLQAYTISPRYVYRNRNEDPTTEF
ncbi:hypothetical protein HY483_00560 [Candidatus Woesearchaeota archaeon]|nr:hypothetical protein [Candidatus Woesearchaeota archaeon]